MVDTLASSNQVGPKATQSSTNPIDSMITPGALIKESTSLSHLLKQRISSHKLNNLPTMDWLSGAPGAAGTVAGGRPPVGLMLGLVTDEIDQHGEVIGSGPISRESLKGIRMQKNAGKGGGAGRLGAARGIVVASGSSAAISRGTIRSRKRNERNGVCDLGGQVGIEAMEGGYGDEEDFLEVYVDLVHREELQKSGAYDQTNSNIEQQQSKNYKSNNRLQGKSSGRVTGIRRGQGMLTSALAGANVSILGEGCENNKLKLKGSGAGIISACSKSALDDDQQSFSNLSKKTQNRHRIKEYPPFIYSEQSTSVGRKLVKNQRNDFSNQHNNSNFAKMVKHSLRNSRPESIGSILHQQKIQNDNFNKRESKALKQFSDKSLQKTANQQSNTQKNSTSNQIDLLKQHQAPSHNQIDQLISTYGMSTFSGLNHLTLKNKSRGLGLGLISAVNSGALGSTSEANSMSHPQNQKIKQTTSAGTRSTGTSLLNHKIQTHQKNRHNQLTPLREKQTKETNGVNEACSGAAAKSIEDQNQQFTDKQQLPSHKLRELENYHPATTDNQYGDKRIVRSRPSIKDDDLQDRYDNDLDCTPKKNAKADYLTKSPSKLNQHEKSQYLHKNSISKYSKVSELIKVTMSQGNSSKSKSKKYGVTAANGDILKYYENMQMKQSVYNQGQGRSIGPAHSMSGTNGSTLNNQKSLGKVGLQIPTKSSHVLINNQINQSLSNRKNLHFKYQILPGNNSELVERVFTEGCPLRSQVWYDLGNKQQNHYHFRWAPISRSINYERLSHNFTQVVNHFEGHVELSRKHELFKNIKQYLEHVYDKNVKYNNCPSTSYLRAPVNLMGTPMLFQIMPLQFHIKLPQALSHHYLSQTHIFLDQKSIKVLNQHIKMQIAQFQKVFQLMEEYGRTVQNEQSQGNQDEKDKDNLSFSTNGNNNNQKNSQKQSGYGAQSYQKSLNQSSQQSSLTTNIFVTAKGKKKSYDTLEKTVVFTPQHFKKKKQGASNQNEEIVGPQLVTQQEKKEKVSQLQIQQSLGPQARKSVVQLEDSNKIIQVKSFSQNMHTSALCDYIMPQSHYSRRINSDSIGKQANGLELDFKNLWILKPVGLNRGQGIHVINSVKQCKKLIREYYFGKEYHVGGNIHAPSGTSLTKDEQEQSPVPEDQPNNGTSDSTLGVLAENKLPDKDVLNRNEIDDTSSGDDDCDSVKSGGKKFMAEDKNSNTVGQLEKSAGSKQNQKNQNQVANGGGQYLIRCTQFIIQKYIEDPMLIKGRKFDIRVWVLVTQSLDCFFFKEGYIRTSSSKYTTDAAALANDWVHLTNNAIQKHNPTYGDFEDGNQLSFADFRKYLKEKHFKFDPFFDQHILQKIKNYTKLSLEATRKKLNPNKRSQCFEIFGYDYIIDREYNTWLIEANTNPCLEESSELLKMLLPRMLNDALKLTVDRIHKTPSVDIPQPEQPYKVRGYPDNVNMWQILCQLGKKNSMSTSFSGTINQGQADCNHSQTGINSPINRQTTQNQRANNSLMTNPSNSSITGQKGSKSMAKQSIADESNNCQRWQQQTSNANQIMHGYTQDTKEVVMLVNQYEMRVFQSHKDTQAASGCSQRYQQYPDNKSSTRFGYSINR